MFSNFRGNATFFKKSKKKGSSFVKSFTRPGMVRRTRRVRTARRGPSRRGRMKRRVAFGGTKRRGATLHALQKKVNKLSKGVDATTGLLTHRRLQTASFTSDATKSLTTHLVVNNQGINNASVEFLNYFDAATNTFVQKNAADVGGQQTGIRFQAIIVTATVRNNRTVPAKLRVSLVKPKNDTSLAPLQAFTAGLTDIGGADPESVLTRHSDSKVYTDLWKNISGTYKDVTLLPGEQVILKANLGSFDYEPATADADPLQFRVQDKPCVFFIQIMGIISHDSVVSTEHAFGQASVDVAIETVRKITYAAGANIERVFYEDGQPAAFTNVATIAAQPVAANQNFTGTVF